uniref:Nudix hydrolase 17, mitochondrial n=1 Tax=Anthurium amnicola TaxID=1678845 RepID=A0A1D1YAC2_9ARAE
MVAVVARRGRQLQRYTSNGRRLVVGCIPYKFKAEKTPCMDAVDQALEVLVISSQKGQDILFPKGGWESDESIKDAARREAMEEAGVEGNVERVLGKWRYKSKTQDSYKLGYMFPMNVTEELIHWPEMENRKRRWVTVAEARETCQQPWMKKALDTLVKRLSRSSRRSRVSAKVTPLK